MTKCEKMIKDKNNFVKMAQKTNDVCLKAFYYNASKGVKAKMEKMTIKELIQKVR